jgi:hypothetical protein
VTCAASSGSAGNEPANAGDCDKIATAAGIKDRRFIIATTR